MNIVIMGPPGAGKGTICEKLTKDYNYKLISAGDLLREEKSSGSELGNEIASIIDKGNLVPDGMITTIILSELDDNEDDSFLVDGYPRTIRQGNSLDNMMDVSKVIWLNVSEETTIKRNLNRGKTSNRPDDANEEVIKERIKNYNETSAPLKDFYKERIIEIDGEGTPDEVYELIKNKI
jgi:adenylate kinase